MLESDFPPKPPMSQSHANTSVLRYRVLVDHGFSSRLNETEMDKDSLVKFYERRLRTAKDLEEMRNSSAEELNARRRMQFFGTQFWDCDGVEEELGRYVRSLAAQDPELTTAFAKLSSLEFIREQDVKERNERLFPLYQEVRDLAIQRRAELYTPLPVGIHFNTIEDLVTDERLTDIFPLLEIPLLR